MKITRVAVEVLRVPVDRPYLAGGRTVDANWHVLAHVTTSDGVAQAYRVPVCGHVMPEIHAHLVAAVPNGHPRSTCRDRRGSSPAMPPIEKGELVAPPGPGLGLALDEAAVRRHRVT